MKIFFIGGRDIFSVGGIENWMLHLPVALAARGHDITVCCESDEDGVRFYQNVRVLYLKAPKSKYLRKIWASRRATLRALTEGCDLIHYNVWPSAVWSPLAERKGVKTLLMGHGFEWKRSKYNGLQRALLRLCEGWAARRHQHIVLCSQEQTDWYIRHYGCEGKAVTIPSAVDLPEPGVVGADGPFTLLYMGRISPEKNVDLLIRAFARIRVERGVDARLLIAGSMDASGAYGRKIRKLIDSCESVEYVGEVFGEEKEALLRRTRLFCLPSSIEGLSIALLEAAARRIPVLVSDIPSNREALGDNAIWMRPDDLSSLEHAFRFVFPGVSAEDDARVQDMLKRHADRAYERVATRFTWERTVALYDDYIQKIVGK
ncbi:MAG: glycosyltransferase family 4 protein [Bacteroidales bacterium]|nr:glycosyltransferase family 4 protein [Bacteroidales bacterium]